MDAWFLDFRHLPREGKPVVVDDDFDLGLGRLGRAQIKQAQRCLLYWSEGIAKAAKAVIAQPAGTDRIKGLQRLSAGYAQCAEMERLCCSVSGEQPLINASLSKSGAHWNEAHGALIELFDGFIGSQRLLITSPTESAKAKASRAYAISHVDLAKKKLIEVHTAVPVLPPLDVLVPADAKFLAAIIVAVHGGGKAAAKAAIKGAGLADEIVAVASDLRGGGTAIQDVVADCKKLLKQRPLGSIQTAS